MLLNLDFPLEITPFWHLDLENLGYLPGVHSDSYELPSRYENAPSHHDFRPSQGLKRCNLYEFFRICVSIDLCMVLWIRAVSLESIDCMFAKFDKTETLRSIVGCILAVDDRVQFEFTEGGIHVLALDPSHVMLLDLSIDANNLSDYSCQRRLEIGIDIKELERILRKSRTTSSITLKYAADKNHLTIDFVTRLGNAVSVETEICLCESYVVDIPDTDDEKKVAFPSAELVDIIQTFDSIGCATLKIGKIGTHIEFVGKTNNGKATKLLIGRGSRPSSESSPSSSATFNFRLLSKLVRRCTCAKISTLSVAEDRPLEIQCATGIFTARYYITPLL